MAAPLLAKKASLFETTACRLVATDSGASAPHSPLYAPSHLLPSALLTMALILSAFGCASKDPRIVGHVLDQAMPVITSDPRELLPWPKDFPRPSYDIKDPTTMKGADLFFLPQDKNAPLPPDQYDRLVIGFIAPPGLYKKPNEDFFRVLNLFYVFNQVKTVREVLENPETISYSLVTDDRNAAIVCAKRLMEHPELAGSENDPEVNFQNDAPVNDKALTKKLVAMGNQQWQRLIENLKKFGGFKDLGKIFIGLDKIDKRRAAIDERAANRRKMEGKGNDIK